MQHLMDPAGVEVISILRQHGYAAYFVGGCVRDALLGRDIRDYDIATAATPERVTELFAKTIPTGLKYGTVTVVHRGRPFEVTTFRTESAYERHRRPKAVSYMDDLAGDLRRRDFTINAMAMDGSGTVIDPFGGLDDLQRKRLRCVGEAAERFGEDALRMLRCIRFAAEYGLDIEPSTWEALQAHRQLLEHVAMERVKGELDKTVCGSDPARGVRLLGSSGLMRHLKEPMPGQMVEALEDPGWIPPPLDRLASCSLRYALLFASMGMGPEAARLAMKRLRFDGRSARRIADILQFHGEAPDIAGSEEWKLAALRHGVHTLESWLDIVVLLPKMPGGFRSGLTEMTEMGKAWLSEMVVSNVGELAFGGQDAKQLGARGEQIGRLLNALLVETALGRLPNEKEALRTFALQWMKDEEQT